MQKAFLINIIKDKDLYSYMKYCVYRFTNNISGKVYIGSTSKGHKRYQTHINGKGSRLLRDCLKKYSVEDFTYEILEAIDEHAFLNKSQLREYLYDREQIYLDFYFAQEYISSNSKDKRFRKLTYNINPVAKGSLGYKWTDEMKEKLKNKFKEKGHTCLGRKISQETRDKIRDNHVSKEIYKGSKNPNYGVKGTPEKKQKVINAFIESGNIISFYKINKDLVIEGPFLNVKEYCRVHNYESKGFHLCFTGKMRSYKGYAFCKENELQNKLEEIQKDPKYWTKYQPLPKKTCNIKIKNLTTGEIKDFYSIYQAEQWMNLSSLTKALKTNRTKIKDFEILSFEKLAA